MCRHCAKSRGVRPRGLCWACYRDRGIRDLYASGNKFSPRSSGEFHGQTADPEPTTALPGSAEKIAVLTERCRLKQNLWHTHDA